MCPDCGLGSLKGSRNECLIIYQRVNSKPRNTLLHGMQAIIETLQPLVAPLSHGRHKDQTEKLRRCGTRRRTGYRGFYCADPPSRLKAISVVSHYRPFIAPYSANWRRSEGETESTCMCPPIVAEESVIQRRSDK